MSGAASSPEPKFIIKLITTDGQSYYTRKDFELGEAKKVADADSMEQAVINKVVADNTPILHVPFNKPVGLFGTFYINLHAYKNKTDSER